MQIDDNLVNHLANLARLKLTDAERSALKNHLQKIISYVDELKELDVTGITPLVHAGGDQNVLSPFGDAHLRDDTPRPSLPVDKALQNAPDKQGNFFRVPRVIETTDAH